MDFHSMKRKQLQALCKKHKIPANLSNLEMANRLTEFLKERENQEENVSEIEANDVILNKKAKKVRVSQGRKGISRRNSVYCMEGDSSVEIVKSGEWNKAAVSRRGNAMRTGDSNLIEAEVKQKKRGVEVVKCAAAAANGFGDAELEEVDLDRSGRVMSLRGKMAAEGVKNASTRQRKRAKCDEKRDEKASVSANEEIVNNHSRVTRSRAQKLTEAPVVKEKIGSKVVKTIGKVAAGGNRETLSKRGDEGDEKSALGSEVHVTVEPQLRLRRSKRKVNMVGESEKFATDAPKVDVEIIEISGTVEPRRRNKRKTMVESGVLRVETDNRFLLRSSLLQSDIVPEGDVVRNNNDLNCGAESSNGSSSMKVVSAAAMRKSADERNQPHRPDHSSLHHGSSGTEETLLLDVQLPVSKDSESANNLCSKSITSDVESRETHKEKEEVSIADGAGSSCTNLTNGEDLVNSDTNAVSKIAEQVTDTSVSDDQNSTSNIVEVENSTLLLEVDVEETIEQNTTEVEKNDSEAQVHSQMEDSGYINKINDQVLAEGLNVFGDEGSAETFTSTDSFLRGDQTAAETDLKVAETEADEHVQPCVIVIGDHNNLDHLEASCNFLVNNNENTSQTFGEDESFESCSMTRHQGDDVAEEDETFFHKGRASELAEADESGCLKNQKGASNRLSAFDMADLSKGERDARIDSPNRGIFADEYSVFDSEVHVTPIAICTASTDVNLKRDHEDDQITETHESESSKDHNSKCDEDEEFSLNKLFDEEGKYGNTSQERVNFSSEHSVKDFNEQEMSHGSPSLALPTMCNSSGDHEANLSAEGGETFNFKNIQSEWTEADISGCLKSHMKSSNSQETNPSTPFSDSETQAKKQKSLLVKSNALANTNQRQGAWSNTSELTGNAVCFLKSSEENISLVMEGHNPDEYVNHANHGIDKKASAEATSSDVQSCLISKIMAESLGDEKFQDSMETEHQHKNLLAMRTDAETELHNLFGTSDEDDHPRLGGTYYQGSETTNMSMSRNKSTASNCDSMTKKQEKEMDGGSSHEHAEMKNKNVVLPSGFDADIYENEFKVLFATPVKIMTPYKIEEACSHGRVLNGSVLSIKKCSDAMKGNVTTESTANEKTQDAGYEVENKSSIAASLSDNGGDDVCEEINEVESFELSPTKVSEGEFVGCEALDDQLSQHKEECLDEKISLTNEDWEEHAIPLVQSCLNDEETNSPRDLNELESCAQNSEIGSCKSKAHKFEGEMTQSTTELFNAGLQKFDVLENSHLLTRCSLDGNNLRETLVETSSDPEVAKNGSSEKDMTDTGISPFLCLKVSLDCEDLTLESHDQYEAKRFDEDGNPQSSQDISAELPNNEVAIQESVSIGNTCQDQLPSIDELERTCKEANSMETTIQSLYDTDVAAEHEPFVCWALSDLVSNLEAGEPTFNLDNGKVQDAGVEHGNNLSTGHLLSDDDEEDNCGKMDDLEIIALKFTSTTVLPKTEYDGCEVSQKQLTELIGECQKETNFVTEGNEERVIYLGQSCLFDEEVDNDNESTEEYINSLSGTPNNLDKHEGQDMLIDTALGESLSCKTSIDHKSEEMTQCSGAAIELSGANLQKSNISKNSRDVIDEGTYLHLSPKASAVYNELTQSTNTDDLTGAKICCESHINSEAGLACCLELESTFMEMEEAGMTTQDLSITVAPTEHDSPVCTAVSGILSSSEMHLHQRDENSSIKNLDLGKPIFMSINNDMKDSEKAEENSTAEMVQFSIEELHSEENVEDFKNDEEMENDSESAEENINSLSGTPNSSDKHEGCQDMLTVTALGESLCCEISVDHKSKQEMTQCSEAAVELSDVDLQKSNISKNSQDVVDEGTCLLLSSKAPTDCNEFAQSTNTNDLNGAKICDEIHSKSKSSQDMPDESCINSEVAILKSLSDSDHQSEEVKLDCCLELESMFMETEEIGTTTQDLHNIVALTEHGSPAGASVSSILSNSNMHLHQRHENSSIKNLDVGINNEKKDSEKPEENTTAEMVQVSIQELHYEENVEDFNNDTPTILPPTGYNEILKESDVADAIKEHVDSESSLSVMFENSSISLPSDILSHTDEVIASFKHEDNVPSVDCFNEEIQEQVEAALLTRPVDFLDEGTTVKLESQGKIESEDWQSSTSKELGAIIKKNARTVLIHGTPGKKLLSMADMKENVPPQKSSNAGDITAARPAKRRALQDLQWK